MIILQDINYMDGYEMRKDTEVFFKQVTTPPGVPVHCLHGINVRAFLNFHKIILPSFIPTEHIWLL